MNIELCIYYNIVTIWFLFIIQSINLPPSAHTITSSAHTTAAITSSVHTATMYSHVQLSAANFQCTLQPIAAIYNHLYYNYTIQCTLQLHYLMLIPYSASSEEG